MAPDHTETGTTCTINRLFGLNGRERLWVDIDHAIDEANGVAAWGDMPKPPPVEEWDVYPPAYHLPDAEWAAEFAAEHACGTDMDPPIEKGGAWVRRPLGNGSIRREDSDHE
jgi:hypothetical protein